MVVDRGTIALLGIAAVGVTGMLMQPRHNAQALIASQDKQAETTAALINDFAQRSTELFQQCALPPAPVIQTALSPGQTLIFTQPGAPPADGSPPPQSSVECVAPSAPDGINTSDAGTAPASSNRLPSAPVAANPFPRPLASEPSPGSDTLLGPITPAELFDQLLQGSPQPGTGLLEPDALNEEWTPLFRYRRGFGAVGGGSRTVDNRVDDNRSQRDDEDDKQNGNTVEPSPTIQEPGTLALVAIGISVLTWRAIG